MYFKSLSDLGRDVHDWVPQLAGRFDCVVGIPRSGMLVASMLALKLNLPLGDLDGFLQGRLLAMGKRFGETRAEAFLKTRRRVLIVDDSISSGLAIREARQLIADTSVPHDLTFAAVYITSKGKELCGEYCELVPNPRRFEWNILSSTAIQRYCFDMDGVLCLDPSKEDNDDGDRYRDFILTAQPLYIPNHKIGAIVTSRLEKFRPETETWLKRNGIEYGELVMLNLPTKEDRIRLKAAPSFKAEFYKKSSHELFIESEHNQAVRIAEASDKFVYALDSVTMHGPGKLSSLILRNKMTLKKRIKGKLKHLIQRVKGA
jgi:uncharacterized HAD superfamily protein/hypoxanthine phosphoribosyltransferase